MSVDLNEESVTHKLCLCGAAPLPRNLSRRRRAFTHQRLLQPPLQLSVLKLDGSCFDVRVKKEATVAELKHAVEDVFLRSASDGDLTISWEHVWGSFSLSYKDQKLVDDKTRIQSFGVRDGDQLKFVRHPTANGNVEKRRMKHHPTLLSSLSRQGFQSQLLRRLQ